MDKVEIKEYQNLSEPVRVTVVTGLLNMEGVRVPAGGKEGQNLTKKSDKDYDVYWADPDDINSIEHITLNGEEVPVENKTAKITVDKSTVGLDNVDNTADVNKPVSKLQQNALSRLNEAIAKNPEKLYLTWKGYNFPYSSDTRFTMPAGSYIDWGDGVIDAFTTIQQSDSTDTQVSFGVLNKPDNVSKLNHGINDVDYIRKENVTCVILNNENDVITLKSVHDITSFDYVDITLQVCDESDSENEYSIYSGDIEFNQTIDGKTPRGSHWETIRLSIDQLRQGGSYITDETITSAWKACQQFKTYYEQDNALFLNFGTHFKGQEVWVYIADIRWGIVVPSAVRKVATENTSTVATHMYTGDDFILTHLISIYGLSQIPEDGFINASYLIDIRFPTNAIDINYRAFCLCQKLTHIELPHTRSIGEAAFLNSNFIKYVRLGQWIKSIGDSAFSGCDQIEKFYIDADTPPTLGKNAFYYTSDQLKIIVPKSSIDAYKSAAGWSEYADKIVYEVDSSDLDKAITDLDVDNIAYVNKENTFTKTNKFTTEAIFNYITVNDGNAHCSLSGSSLSFNGGHTTYGDNKIFHISFDGTDLNYNDILLPDKSGTLALIEDLTAKLDKPTVTDSNYKIVTYNGTSSGTLDYSNAPNASSIIQRDADGRAQVVSGVSGNDIVNYSQLETKYDKTGGTIGGNVVITGDLTVNGTQHINNTENLNVENAMIYSNANGATLATNGGLGIKKNATDVYGIVYDPTSDSVKLGIGKSDTNGRFTFNANEGQPVAIRDDSSKFTNNHIIKWDSTNHKLVDSGKKVGDLSTATNLENGTGTGSLVQTNVVSSSGTPYTNRATGSGAIALGKNCWSGGNTAFTIGQQNKTGNNSGTGDSNSGKGGFTHGYNNINEGHYTEVGGSGNIVEGDGADTIVNGRNNHIIKSNHSAVFGDTNRVDSTYNPNNGADDNIVGGKNNKVGSSGNIVGGESNTANGNNNSLIIGSHNSINTNSSGDRIVGGHYNKPVANGLMEIGNGTSDTDRKNAFVVLEDGRAKVQSAPTENNDVLRYQDTAVEVETSLMGA